MPDFEPLDDVRDKAATLVERFRRRGVALDLRRHAALAVLSLTDSVSAGLDPASRTEALLLQDFATRRADAYRTLSRVPDGQRWVRYRRTQALRDLGLPR